MRADLASEECEHAAFGGFADVIHRRNWGRNRRRMVKDHQRAQRARSFLFELARHFIRDAGAERMTAEMIRTMGKASSNGIEMDRRQFRHGTDRLLLSVVSRRL